MNVNRDNLWKTVRFTIEGQVIERHLVPDIRDFSLELNVESPVGKFLATARTGDQAAVPAPGGPVVVEVLQIL